VALASIEKKVTTFYAIKTNSVSAQKGNKWLFNPYQNRILRKINSNNKHLKIRKTLTPTRYFYENTEMHTEFSTEYPIATYRFGKRSDDRPLTSVLQPHGGDAPIDFLNDWCVSKHGGDFPVEDSEIWPMRRTLTTSARSQIRKSKTLTKKKTRYTPKKKTDHTTFAIESEVKKLVISQQSFFGRSWIKVEEFVKHLNESPVVRTFISITDYVNMFRFTDNSMQCMKDFFWFMDRGDIAEMILNSSDFLDGYWLDLYDDAMGIITLSNFILSISTMNLNGKFMFCMFSTFWSYFEIVLQRYTNYKVNIDRLFLCICGFI